MKFHIALVNGPIFLVLKQILISLGCEVVHELVDANGHEADVVITNNIVLAQTMMKETENTIIMLTYLSSEEQLQAEGFASRASGRVRPVWLLGEKDSSHGLMFTITDVMKGRAE